MDGQPERMKMENLEDRTNVFEFDCKFSEGYINHSMRSMMELVELCNSYPRKVYIRDKKTNKHYNAKSSLEFTIAGAYIFNSEFGLLVEGTEEETKEFAEKFKKLMYMLPDHRDK